MFTSVPVVAEHKQQFAVLQEGVSNTSRIDCPRGGSTALPFVMDFIQAALEQVDAPECLHHVGNFIITDAEEGLRPPLLHILVRALVD